MSKTGIRGEMSAKKTSRKRSKPVAHDTRQQMIAEAAYYLAEKRGFAEGGDVRDWLEAERAVETVLGRAS